MSFKVVRAGLSQSRQVVKVAGSCLVMSKQFALQLQPIAAECPNTQNPGDLQRASDCFKNTLFFRKYSVQYSVLCSPQLQPPGSTEAKATSGRSLPQLESTGQVSLTPFPSSQGGRWLSSPRWYPAAPRAAQITVPSSDRGADDGPWWLGTSPRAHGGCHTPQHKDLG